MPAGHCLNCERAYDGRERFCAQCGQRVDTGRLTFADIVRDLMHTFVNIERGPLMFALALLRRPGEVAREYVQGRRRRYYGPFATLVVVVGLAALAVNATGFHVLAQDGLPAGPADLLERHFNVLLLVQFPLLGAVCALVFRRARLTLPEHMVLVAYAFSVRAAFTALMVPLAYAVSPGGPRPIQVALFWAAWYLYFGWAASQFYEGSRWRNGVFGVLAAVLGHAAIVGLLALASAAYLALTRPA